MSTNKTKQPASHKAKPKTNKETEQTHIQHNPTYCQKQITTNTITKPTISKSNKVKNINQTIIHEIIPHKQTTNQQTANPN